MLLVLVVIVPNVNNNKTATAAAGASDGFRPRYQSYDGTQAKFLESERITLRLLCCDLKHYTLFVGQITTNSEDTATDIVPAYIYETRLTSCQNKPVTSS